MFHFISSDTKLCQDLQMFISRPVRTHTFVPILSYILSPILSYPYIRSHTFVPIHSILINTKEVRFSQILAYYSTFPSAFPSFPEIDHFQSFLIGSRISVDQSDMKTNPLSFYIFYSCILQFCYSIKKKTEIELKKKYLLCICRHPFALSAVVEHLRNMSFTR